MPVITRAQHAKATLAETAPLTATPAASETRQGAAPVDTLGLPQRKRKGGTDGEGSSGASPSLRQKRGATNLPQLSVERRPAPLIVPQTLGRYAAQVLGDWSVKRDALPARVAQNLLALASAPSAERDQLHDEITLHWHSLSEAEKVKVLDAVGKAGNARLVADPDDTDPKADPANPSQRGPVRNWLDHTFFVMPEHERDRLLAASSASTQASLDKVFHAKETYPGLESRVKKYRNDNAIDTLYDYAGFMRANAVIGTLPEAVKDRKVAIVGAGAAGLAAGFELNKVGANVHIIEATGRIGGRMDARPFPNADGSITPSRAEMGAMRFPPAGKLFFHYLKQFDVKTIPNFPNPGTVPTKMYFQNRVIDWVPGQPPNDPVLQQVSADFQKVIKSIMDPMERARDANDVGKMRELWQGYVDKYKDVTFRQATGKLLDEHGIEWGKDQFDAFGALGVGTGGFGPLYQNGFLEILRVILDHLETGQQLLPEGTTSAMHKFASTQVERPDGTRASLNEQGAFRLNTEVLGVSSKSGKPTLTLKNSDGTETAEQFDAVIYTGNPRSAEHAQLTLRTPESDPILSEVVTSAIEQTHLLDSSKLFIKVKKRFWEGQPHIPQTIQTDQSLHGAYCLAYPGSEHGVVLLSYTWEDKSTKLQALPPEERLKRFRKEIEQISPEFAANLEPVDGNIHCIDWQAQQHQYGAFKLDHPGQSQQTNDTYSQFQSVLPDNEQPDSGVYVAGDGVSYAGGWIVGALNTGINAACATVQHLGGTLAPNAPLTQDTKMYQY